MRYGPHWLDDAALPDSDNRAAAAISSRRGDAPGVRWRPGWEWRPSGAEGGGDRRAR